ncbi:MAG: hypothetical protein IT245_09255, partial [Bacteroidia bacterium]|nr:hypothetical protein [Bacteroidia bacterium]
GPVAAPNIDAGYTVPNIEPFIGGTSIIKTADSLCAGSNLDSITVKYTGTSPYRIFWFNENTNTFSTFSTSADSFVIHDLEAGTYLIKVKDANCNIFQQRTTVLNRTTGCNFTVTGTLFNDSNGLVNGSINGRAFGDPSGASMYVYLVNSLGVVVDSSVINPLNGTYSLTGVRFSNYTLRISTTAAGIGASAPAASLPTTWVNVGEQYGSSNNAGTGIESGTPNGDVSVTILSSNITNVNFGIERKPSSSNQAYSITTPSFNLQDTMRLNRGGLAPGGLTGTDAEDGNLGVGSKVRIYAPTSNELYYDSNNDGVLSPGELITDSITINSYNPDLLIAKYVTVGSTSLSFGFNFIDNANFLAARNTYTVSWLTPLPAYEISITSNCINNKNVLNWNIQGSENKTFILERNIEGNTWTELLKFEFSQFTEFNHYIDSNYNNICLYRLRTNDNSFNSTIVRGSCNNVGSSLRVYPNPSNNIVNIWGLTEFESIKTYNVLGLEVNPIITIQNDVVQLRFDKLSSGSYTILIQINDTEFETIQILIER